MAANKRQQRNAIRKFSKEGRKSNKRDTETVSINVVISAIPTRWEDAGSQSCELFMFKFSRGRFFLLSSQERDLMARAVGATHLLRGSVDRSCWSLFPTFPPTQHCASSRHVSLSDTPNTTYRGKSVHAFHTSKIPALEPRGYIQYLKCTSHFMCWW